MSPLSLISRSFSNRLISLLLPFPSPKPALEGGHGGKHGHLAATCIVGAAVNLVSLLFYLVAVRWRAQAEKTWTTSATSDTAGGAGEAVGAGEAGETAVGGTGGIPGDMGDSDGAAVVLHSSGRDVELAGN